MSIRDPSVCASILVVDDHPVVRYGLVQLLEGEADFEVIGAASSCEELCRKAADLSPDIVLMDLEMGDSSGVEAVARLRRQRYRGHIVVFSAHDDRDLVLKALELNVRGYVKKASSHELLCEAIRAVTDGGLYLDASVAPKIVGHLALSGKVATPKSGVRLTASERAVLEQIAIGKRNKDIAEELSISERAVKYHVTSILAKFCVRNRTEAVEAAVRNKLISLS